MTNNQNTHYISKTVEYKAWENMKRRCYTKGTKQYHDYGGRGITVCERWLGKDGAKNFIADMGERPIGDYSLDRIDNDGNYEPDNCRWATRGQQRINSRERKLFENNKSGHKLVHWDKNLKRFKVQVTKNGTHYSIGLYKCVADAAFAQKAFTKLYAQFEEEKNKAVLEARKEGALEAYKKGFIDGSTDQIIGENV